MNPVPKDPIAAPKVNIEPVGAAAIIVYETNSTTKEVRAMLRSNAGVL